MFFIFVIMRTHLIRCVSCENYDLFVTIQVTPKRGLHAPGPHPRHVSGGMVPNFRIGRALLAEFEYLLQRIGPIERRKWKDSVYIIVSISILWFLFLKSQTNNCFFFSNIKYKCKYVISKHWINDTFFQKTLFLLLYNEIKEILIHHIRVYSFSVSPLSRKHFLFIYFIEIMNKQINRIVVKNSLVYKNFYWISFISMNSFTYEYKTKINFKIKNFISCFAFSFQIQYWIADYET